MPEAILRLRVNPETGRREIVIDYTSDSDALPIEHEEEHRKLAEKVVDGGLGALEVRREQEVPAAAQEKPGQQPVATPVATKR